MSTQIRKHGLRSAAAIAVWAAVLWMALAVPANAERLALVIGNDRYTALPTLQKAVNDARSVAATLDEIGFKVFLGENLTRRETNRKLADFVAAIKPGDEAFFFFAGHGVAVGAENYLIPSDMPEPRSGEEGLLRDEAHSVNSLIERVQRRGAKTTFFVLDACRDNPFAAKGVRSIGLSRGLTRVEAPSGVFVLFSAGIGQTALDRLSDTDADANSVFTRKLIPLLNTPGLTHVRLAKQVQKQVSALARTVSHNQQPAYYDQIIGDIVLRPEASKQAKAPAEPVNKQPANEAAQAWSVIQDTKSTAVLKAFVAEFPNSVFAEFARARLQELQPSTAPESRETDTAALNKQAPVPADSVDETPPTSRSSDQTALVRAIQTQLNRHRCNAGPVDGAWGGKSRRAVGTFARYAKLTLAPQPSDSLLDILKSRKVPVCPPPVTTVKKQAQDPVKVAPQPATRVFRNPKIRGMPIDICVTRKRLCKGQAARLFCRHKGYKVATSSQYVVYPATRHIGTGRVCRPRGLVVCGGYSVITCAR